MRLFYKKESLKVWRAEDSLLSLPLPVQHPREQNQLNNGSSENATTGSPMPTTCFSIHVLAPCQTHNPSRDISALLSNIWIYKLIKKAPQIYFLNKTWDQIPCLFNSMGVEELGGASPKMFWKYSCPRQ